ncbi:Uncharacterized membrane protein [Caminicella sporogenes DSM 14501]|uniref:Uncharacterized membrane protein n=1 Tax=Caminicella sporogenes DSM 14501 TaxID=1121266 RepID=A0A1M6NNF9_9FIRM|nr:QueT transporter family protein [Caminicella sporogenes]RKD22142.1 transporter [Caminicella sporogenes]WIF95760.1 QueT transporter family protein [Caminicella sporogenes]SHJ97225.1 Uncharacterized membrane protein [Caminicella sporogenes DSM 14501]
MKNTKFLIQASVIAAIYAVLTIVFAPISYGEIQIRISEALTILPYFTPAAILGLFVGCLIANLLSPVGILDIIFGSLASLIAAYLSYKMPKKWLVPLPPVIVNGIIIGLLLKYAYGIPLPLILLMAYVSVGQIIACYGLGYPLMSILEKYKKKIFN